SGPRIDLRGKGPRRAEVQVGDAARARLVADDGRLVRTVDGAELVELRVAERGVQGAHYVPDRPAEGEANLLRVQRARDQPLSRLVAVGTVVAERDAVLRVEVRVQLEDERVVAALDGKNGGDAAVAPVVRDPEDLRRVAREVLVAREEEQLVLDDRALQEAAEALLAEGRR